MSLCPDQHQCAITSGFGQSGDDNILLTIIMYKAVAMVFLCKPTSKSFLSYNCISVMFSMHAENQCRCAFGLQNSLCVAGQVWRYTLSEQTRCHATDYLGDLVGLFPPRVTLLTLASKLAKCGNICNLLAACAKQPHAQHLNSFPRKRTIPCSNAKATAFAALKGRLGFDCFRVYLETQQGYKLESH